MKGDVIKDRSRILIVLPTLGQRLELLAKTLRSLKNQGIHNPDIIVVCPLGNNNAVKLAHEYGAKAIDDPGSISAAVNAGFKLAKPHHEYMGWLGDDDLLRPNSLYRTTLALDANPGAALAYGYCDYIDINDKVIFTSKAGGIAPWLMTWGPNLVPLPGILFRRSALDKTGGFDETLRYAMDLDLLLRLRNYGTFYNTKSILAAFRWHPQSTTVASRSASLKEAESIKRRYMNKNLRHLAFLWEMPVRIATHLATRHINSVATKQFNE